MKCIKNLIYNLWGLTPGRELTKFLYLAGAAFCLIGSFSPLKPLKDSLFIDMVGPDYYTHVKILSSILMLLVVLLYSRIVDYFTRQNLMYAFLCFFLCTGLVFAGLLLHPVLGVANKTVGVHRWVAWGFYLFVECYLTMMISLFWSFVNDITSSSSAKKGYGMIMFGSQTGAVLFAALGAWLVAQKVVGEASASLLLGLCMALFALLGFFVWRLTALFADEYSASQARPEKSKERSVAVWQGAWMVVTNPYIASIFGLVLFQESIVSLMHYQQAYLVKQTLASSDSYYFAVNFMFQLLSCVFALFGTSYIHRTIGTRGSLMSFPILLMVAAGWYLCSPNLYAVTVFIVLLKGLHYAFNQPVRETLYIPTSRDIKYKAKAWIDVVGLRGAKSLGFLFANVLGHAPLPLGGAITGLLALWTLLASRVGAVNEEAVSQQRLIE